MIPVMNYNFESISKSVREFLANRFGFNFEVIPKTEENNDAHHITDGDNVSVKIKAYVKLAPDPSGSDYWASGASYRALLRDKPLVDLLSTLLEIILRYELRALEEQRKAERLELEAKSDSLTHLYNRRAWDEFMVKEEERCKRYGHPAAVFVIDLDNLKVVNDTAGHAVGDTLIVCASNAIKQAARSIDIVSRLGGDEFGIIAVECNHSGAVGIMSRVRSALEISGIKASVGMAMRTDTNNLKDAWVEADQLMYCEKRSK